MKHRRDSDQSTPSSKHGPGTFDGVPCWQNQATYVNRSLLECRAGHRMPNVTLEADLAWLGYGENGERLVAGVIPLSADKTQVLVVESTRRGGWVLPKGGWETDEGTAQDAACREAWEEAGIVCKVQSDLGAIPEMRVAQEKSTADKTNQTPKATYRFFEVIVEKEEKVWPEMHKRGRQWLSYAEAVVAFKERPELLEALNRSSIVR